VMAMMIVAVAVAAAGGGFTAIATAMVVRVGMPVIGPGHVDVPLGSEHPRQRDVDQHPDAGDPGHERPVHRVALGGHVGQPEHVVQALDGFDAQPHAHQRQRYHAEEGGKGLAPLQPERVKGGAGEAGEVVGEDRDDEAGHVAEEVGRVAQDGERPRQVPAHHLHAEEGHAQGRRDFQPLHRAAPG
jgi:hypothetical protein